MHTENTNYINATLTKDTIPSKSRIRAHNETKTQKKKLYVKMSSGEHYLLKPETAKCDELDRLSQSTAKHVVEANYRWTAIIGFESHQTGDHCHK